MDLAKLSLAWDVNSSQFIHFPVPVSSSIPVLAQTSETPSPAPSFREALRFWVKLGFVSFGGPAGQIAIMHTELVDRKKWISEPLFLHALNFCMLLPGPEAQQLATYLGWRLHGVRGGIAAGALFVLPAVVILWALSWLYMSLGHVEWVAAIFYGLQPAVMAIVAAAVLRVGRKALRNSVMWALAAVAFLALFVFKAPFAAVMLGAGLLGWFGSQFAPRYFGVGQDQAKGRKESSPVGGSSSNSAATGVELGDEAAGSPSGWAHALRVVGGGAPLWWVPILLAGWLAGWQSVWFKLGFFFSKAALITFGGAYAVLPYVAQQAVDQYHWLTTPQMMSGLALAETTPGPLIMVLQFVGFAGAWQNPGALPPLLAATLGAAVTTWATFLPSFIFVLTGAPYIERLRRVRGLTAMLSAITAAVVGVILNLAVWFGIHTLWPGGGAIDLFALVLAAVLFTGMHWRKWEVIPVVVVGGVLGLVWRLLLVGAA
jgi:chromate transporter